MGARPVRSVAIPAETPQQIGQIVQIDIAIAIRIPLLVSRAARDSETREQPGQVAQVDYAIAVEINVDGTVCGMAKTDSSCTCVICGVAKGSAFVAACICVIGKPFFVLTEKVVGNLVDPITNARYHHQTDAVIDDYERKTDNRNPPRKAKDCIGQE